VRRQAETAGDVHLPNFVVGCRAGDRGDRQRELALHQLQRAPARHRIRRGHHVGRPDRHQLLVPQDVLHAVFAENPVAQLGHHHVGLGGGEPIEDALGGGDRDPGVSAGDADVIESERRDRTGVEHGERVAHERHAGELRRSHPEPAPSQPAHQLGGGHGLAGVHAGAGDVDHRDPALEHVGGRHRAVADVGRPAHPIAELGKG
jgi:hypothetical protein